MVKKDIENGQLDQAAKAMLVQAHQRQNLENQLGEINLVIDGLSNINRANLEKLKSARMKAEMVCNEQDIDIKSYEKKDKENSGERILEKSYDELTQVSRANLDKIKAARIRAELLCKQRGIDLSNYKNQPQESAATKMEENLKVQMNKLEIISMVGSNTMSWKEYMENIEKYKCHNNVDFSRDPFESLMTSTEIEEMSKRIREDYTMKQANCDKYDYLIAGFCGVANGLIDVFFVGMPNESKLGNWTDKETDNLVEKFTKSVWASDKKNNATNSKSAPEGITSAIRYLEGRFNVNYDARYASDLKLGENTISMSAKNHHLKSLGHAPDLIGLFFSVLDQFTGKNSFISDGKIIRVEPVEDKFELKGGNFFAKLFCGFYNWLGHIMSDIAGASGARGRGAGVPVPFFEMFQLCSFGSLNINGEQKNLAELSVKIFESGYDARHGAAMAIPVVLNEMMIRLCWAIKSRFYHECSWKESMPFGNKPELRRMLLVGHGSLCLVDGVGAGLQSGGEILTFALHLNSVAWARLGFAGLQEIRTSCNKNALDLSSLDSDLKLEWNRLYDIADCNE